MVPVIRFSLSATRGTWMALCVSVPILLSAVPLKDAVCSKPGQLAKSWLAEPHSSISESVGRGGSLSIWVLRSPLAMMIPRLHLMPKHPSIPRPAKRAWAPRNCLLSPAWLLWSPFLLSLGLSCLPLKYLSLGEGRTFMTEGRMAPRPFQALRSLWTAAFSAPYLSLPRVLAPKQTSAETNRATQGRSSSITLLPFPHSWENLLATTLRISFRWTLVRREEKDTNNFIVSRN